LLVMVEGIHDKDLLRDVFRFFDLFGELWAALDH
jgi:hypothetical protein